MFLRWALCACCTNEEALQGNLRDKYCFLQTLSPPCADRNAEKLSVPFNLSAQLTNSHLCTKVTEFAHVCPLESVNEL